MPKSTISEKPSNVESIKKRIMDLANKHFERGERIYHLSQLGNDLGNDRVILEKEAKKKLKDFIVDETTLETKTMGDHKNIFYICAPDTLPTLSSPRYVSSFWAAFVVPLEKGKKRIINLNTLQFESLDNPDIIGDGSADIREIEERYIAKEDMPKNDEETLRRIRSWISQQHLEESRFYKHNHTPQRKVRSLLDHLLMTLDTDQQKRVTLSLDIVKSIYDRKV